MADSKRLYNRFDPGHWSDTFTATTVQYRSRAEAEARSDASIALFNRLTSVMFARWLATNYTNSTLNTTDHMWWNEQYDHFSKNVMPNIVRNESLVESFLQSERKIKNNSRNIW